MPKPTRPIKSKYKTEGEYKAAIKTHSVAKRKWDLENNPNKLPGETSEGYKVRQEKFKRQIEGNLSPMAKTWEKIKSKQNNLTPTAKMLSEIGTSPIDVGYNLSKRVNVNGNEKLRSDKQKVQEGLDLVESGADAISLLVPFAKASKYSKTLIPSIKSQVSKRFAQEVAEESAFGAAGKINDYIYEDDTTQEDIMKKKTIKKYAMGTGKNGLVRNYIETPDVTLAENSINMSKAKSSVLDNQMLMALNMIGGTAMSAGMDMAGGTSGVMGGAAEGLGGLFKKKAFGGRAGARVEVEGEEVGETPGGQLLDFDGPSHEKGGIDVTLPEGTEIFSKRIKVKGKTMAERKLEREKKKSAIEKQLEKTPNDTILKNTLKRIGQTNDSEEAKDQEMQDVIGAMQEIASYAFGTGREGVQKMKSGGPVKPLDFTGHTGLLQILRNTALQDTPLQDEAVAEKAPAQYSTRSMEKTEAELAEKTAVEAGSKSGIPNFTPGDLFSLAGAAQSTFAPRKNAEASRASDVASINPYEDFGNDALDAIESSMGYIGGQQDKALRDIETSRTRTTTGNRQSARGINTQRALDLGAQVNADNATSDVYDNFSKQMMQLFSQKAGIETQQDQAVMSGEEKRLQDEADKKDNYYNSLADSISIEGQGMQQIGKAFNQNKKNTATIEAINNSSANFMWDGTDLVDKNNNKVISIGQMEKAARDSGIFKADGVTPDVEAWRQKVIEQKNKK